MLKNLVALGAAAFLLSALPVQAAEKLECTDAAMGKMEAEGAKMTDETKKAEAMKEMTMAKEMMGKKDSAGCLLHMENAMKMMPAAM
jgi:hypothetical protein